MREWVKVESTNVDAVCYEQEVLFVKFKGGACYQYTSVPPSLYEQLMLAESKGNFLNKQIKGTYNYTLTKDGE